MPKPVKKPARKKKAPAKRASDPNRRAHQMMAELEAKQAKGQSFWAKSTGKVRHTPSEELPDVSIEAMDRNLQTFQEMLSAHMAKLGAKGGKIGGKRRLETMTSEQRSLIALKAAQSRWGKKRKRSDGA